ncbi:RtcB family protein [Succinatimonas hippei]|uniref:RtcB family protein n=1 Tax=Succinatimonas hippei TaxID=626938 RepID=UPI002010EBF1|nr:RtcB family protein [Succinatimonas hippei]MCL1603144.1 RtcB family protein [Succinatimonas hippei]
MIEVKGKFNTAKIFTDVIDNASLGQVKSLCDQEFAAGSKIRMMPDIHAGAGCTVGTTMTIKDKVVPNLVGVDIGCGMEIVKIRETRIIFQKLDKFIRENIPSGLEVRRTNHKYLVRTNLSELLCNENINLARAEKSIGTLGGGNHFIEVDQDSDGALYIVVHSGSRHLGLEVAQYYQEEGYKRLVKHNNTVDECVDKIIEKMKNEGKSTEISSFLQMVKTSKKITLPKTLAYVSGDLFEQYINDMKIVQSYAAVNRQAMIDDIVKGMKLHVEEQFTTIHNYIDTDKMILRKGAVSAEKGEKFLIPINMRDGSIICVGKGNEDWNYSAPHGAGRLMSRTEAKNSYTLSEFKKQMQGIYSTSINESTLDECPMAYKSMADIVDNIIPTAEIIKIIKPVYNFKAN